MNKNDKICFVCFSIASVCFYIVGITGFLNKNSSTGVINLCLGTSFLCLASMHFSKVQDDKKNKK